MVYIGGIVWDGVEIIFRMVRVNFVGMVLCVYYHRGFSFVCSGDHCILVSDFLFYPL